MAMAVEVMEEFPLLSSWQDHKYWTGFLTSQSQSLLVRLAVRVPNFPSSKGITVEGDADTLIIFAPYRQKMTSVISSEVPLITVLREFRSIVEDYVKTHADRSRTSNLGNGCEFYSTLFGELEQIGHSNVESASSNFGELSLKYIDSSKRKHILRLQVPPQYPKGQIKVSAELPIPPHESLNWPAKLLDIYKAFINEINKYTEFWTTMDELDNRTRIIDPIQPSRSDIYRRILISHNNVLVHLLFNPSSSKAFPEIKFSGPERSVDELDSLLDRDCKKWTESKSILDNLEDILQCEFAAKQDPNETGEEESLETTCVICYTFEFEGNIPETNCECGSVYHDKCLGDLLVNDCSAKAMRFCVECPVCGVELKVSSRQQYTW